MTKNISSMDTHGPYGFRVFYEEYEDGMSDFCIRGVTLATIKEALDGQSLIARVHFPLAWGETMDALLTRLEEEKDAIQQQINEVLRVKAGTSKILTRTKDGVAEWPTS
jgi:DNA-binding transcriptional MerR regulator